MNAEILRYLLDGTVNSEAVNTTSDVVRGNKLTSVLNAASAGETIIVPPGNYKLINATRDGVYVELMEGVLLYHDNVVPIGPGSPDAIIYAASGNHFVTGFGRIEMRYTGSTTGYAVNHTGGNLVCVAQEISSAAALKRNRTDKRFK